jgi:hypothetical protein
MARHKTVTHVPSPVPPAAPRLFAQLATAVGELLAVAIGVVGVVTIVGWVVIGFDVSTRLARHQAPPFDRVDRRDADLRPTWRCWWDPRYRDQICQPVYPGAPSRRYWAREGV